MLLANFHKFSLYSQDYIRKKVFNKLNKNALYNLLLRRSDAMLLGKYYDLLDGLLKSFILIEFINDASLSDDKSGIQIILNDGTKIRYKNIDLDRKTILQANGECHSIVFTMLEEMNKMNVDCSAAVVMEDRPLFGKLYHSVIIKNNIMYDFSHNIMMKFDDYVRLINPKIILYEDKDTILDNINALNENKSKYAPLLKYAIERQRENKNAFK